MTMPRRMPPLDQVFLKEAREAIGLARAGEIARATSNPGTTARKELHPFRLMLLYEMAYLRAFVAWEAFLEESFVRYLCGYSSRHGQAQPAGRGYCRTMPDARRSVLGSQRFMLWHDPTKIAKRCSRFLVNGRHESIVLSSQSKLEYFAAIRHRIAHGQEDARTRFDLATMSLAGRRFQGARPGRFLRDWDTNTQPRQHWLESIVSELGLLASQIV